MRVLLDTQVFLWFFEDPKRLSASALECFADRNQQLFLSPASSWEMAIKWKLGRLVLPDVPGKYIATRMAMISVESLPVQHEHTSHVASLENHHRDPFDRLLIAQAQHESMTIMTADSVFSLYDAPVLWGGK